MIDRILLDNIRLVHGRDTCDEAGRPLTIYTCQYHEGFDDGLEAAATEVHGTPDPPAENQPPRQY